MALEVTATAAPPPTVATPAPLSPPSLPHSVRHVIRGTKRSMVAEQEEEAKGTDENKYGYLPRVIKRVRLRFVSDTPKMEKGLRKERAGKRAGRWLRGGNPNACP